MQTGKELFKKIIIDGQEVNIDTIDANNGVYGNISLSKTKIKVQYVYNDNVTSIPAGVFSGISSLKKVRFPSNIVSIADDAFTGSGIDSDSISTIKAINTRSFRYPITLSVSQQSINVQENGSVSLPTITASSNNNAVAGLTYTYQSSDTSKVTISNGVLNGVASGTATITVTFAGNDNYSGATVQYQVTVSAAQKSQLPNLSVTLNGWKYGSTANSPVVTGNLENGTVSYQYKTTSTSYSNFPPSTSLAPGNYTLKATVAETTTYAQTEATTTFTVSKADGSITISGKSLSYSGSAQDLIVVSNATGTVYFKVKKGEQLIADWSSNMPTATESGSYTIYYYVKATDYYGPIADSTSPNSVSSSISSSSITYTAPTKNENLTYNGQNQRLVIAGSVSSTYGTMKYSTDGTNWSPNVPQRKDVCSNVTVYWKIDANDGYEGINSTSITGCGIAKVTPTVTAPEAASNLKYDGSAKTLISEDSAGSTNYGTLKYSTDGTNYDTNLPTASAAGTYTVYYRVDGDNNINNVTAQTVSCSIAKATLSGITVSISGWTEGETASTPSVSSNPGNGSVTYYYKGTGDYSTTQPSTAGTYKIKATIAATANYNEFTTSEVEFTISSSQQQVIETSASITNDYITEYQDGGDSIDSNNIKVKIKNNSSNTLISGVTFNNLNNEDTWVWNNNGDVTLTLTDDINSGTTAEYNGGTLNNLDGKTPVPSDYPGLSTGNVHMTINADLNQDGFNDTLSGHADDAVQTYSKGNCYTLTVGNDGGITVSVGDNIQSGSYVTSDSEIKVKIKNNTESNLTLTGAIKFKNDNTDIVSTTFSNNGNVTINSGTSSTEYLIDFENNASTYKDKPLTSIELTTSDNETISIALTSATFNMGALYTINYGEVSTDALFDTLLSDFNTVLYGSNSTKLTEDSPDTVAYLDAMYKLADAEWKKSYADSLFNDDLYPEAVEYRNTSDTSGDEATQKAMQGWLMAMCLAELCLSSGSNTNKQTKLYEKAMTYGNSAPYSDGSIDNNGNIVTGSSYGYKKDAMIARFVAGAIYASNHDDLIDEINAARAELGGILINGDDFGDLAYSYSNSHIGYMPELIQILPVTPGPYTTSDDAYNIPSDKPTGNIFYGVKSNTNDDDQRDYNYKMDIAINNYVKQHYNLWDTNSSSSACKQLLDTGSSTQDATTRQLVFEAGAIGICSKFNFFGKKKFKYIGVTEGSTWMHNFDLADTTGETCGEGEYLYKGPFSDWYELFDNPPAINKVYDSEYLNSDYSQNSKLKYLQDMLDIFDERCFIYDAKMGRRRPLGGASAGDPIYTGYNHHPANGLQIATVMQYLADDRSTSYYSYNKIHNTFDDFPSDPPKSYPSGHSAQAWGMAMLLSQIKPSMLKTYMKNAWKFGVERVIGRAHWNSDVLFGRLSALTVLPIINAMNGSSAQTNFMTNYNSLRTIAGNSTITKTGNGVTPSDGQTRINLTVRNDTGEALQSTGEALLYVDTKQLPDEDYRKQWGHISVKIVFDDSLANNGAGPGSVHHQEYDLGTGDEKEKEFSNALCIDGCPAALGLPFEADKENYLVTKFYVIKNIGGTDTRVGLYGGQLSGTLQNGGSYTFVLTGRD